MRSSRKVLIAVLFLIPLLAGRSVFGYDVDDSVPEVTARVARVRLIDGEAKIKHAELDDWELVIPNMPIVEGDEIATEGGARLEIQFDSFNYLRMAEDSHLRVESLQDAGVALSLSQGTLSLRITKFDKGKTYFEIDAPKTTVAIQKEGRYRVDAGFANAAQARIAVTENGQARVYSDDAAFTLRSGRSAKIQLEGNLAGDWEMADALTAADEFDSWVTDRDRIVADLIKDSYYDQYYDRDIYGAEDLSGYGEWVHLNEYGYVWRPYQSVISRYDNWSPYRYGQWRWIPPFGWTWVNDEPWGWATYHYGRWFYDNGYWYWAPYGYYRPSRSWWLPALVSITIVENNVCWYPLPYHSRYHDYNRRFHHDHKRDRGDWQGGRPGGWPRPSPSPTNPTRPPNNGDEAGRWRGKMPPQTSVPPNGIVAVRSGEFGRGKRGFVTPPASMAKAILAKTPPDAEQVPDLPSGETVRSRMGSEIRTERPQNTPFERVRTGAAERKTGAPLDEELRKTRILVNRPPQRIERQPIETGQGGQGNPEKRETGVPRRREIPRVEVPVSQDPTTVTPATEMPKEERRRTEQPSRRVEQPSRKQEERIAEPPSPKQNEPTVESPKPKQEEPRVEAPKRQEEPVYRPRPKQDENPEREERRNTPSPQREERRSEPPKQETPRYEAPKREEPRNDPPPKRDDPPPQKSEPPKKDEPSRPSVIERKKDPGGKR